MKDSAANIIFGRHLIYPMRLTPKKDMRPVNAIPYSDDISGLSRKTSNQHFQTLDLAGILLPIPLFRVTSGPIVSLWNNLGYFALIIVCGLIITTLLFRTRHYRVPHLFLVLVLAIAIINIASTYIHSGDLQSWFYMHLLIVILAIFGFLARNSVDGKPLELFASVSNVLYLILFINIVTGTPEFFNSENRGQYLLGYQNGLVVLAIPLLVLNIALLIDKKWTFLRVLSIFTTSSSVFIVWSTTAMVGVALVWVLVAFFVITRWKHPINLIWFLLISIGIFITVVLMRIQDIPFIQWIIVDILHRDVTFTGRTVLWTYAQARFTQFSTCEYLSGVGFNRELQIANSPYGVTGLHNYIFDLFYYSGIIGIVLYLLVNLYAALKSGQSPQISKSTQVYTAGYGTLLVISQFESYQSYLQYAMLFLLLALISTNGTCDSVSVDESSLRNSRINHNRTNPNPR